MKVPLIDLKAQYSTIREDIEQAIGAVLARQKFILDEEVSAFEAEMAGLTGSRFAIACASGTDALLLSLLALGIQPGEEVITTAYSFFATAGMIAWIKARPVFVDINPETFEMDVSQVAAKIGPKTKAIIAVHLFGQCCNIEALADFGIPVVEDAAQAIGSTRNHHAAGAMGATGCFSFFPTKNLGGYGDGGLITTQEENIATKLRMLRGHGQEARMYYHTIIGTNSRLDELQAAILRVKLRHLKKWNEARTRNALFYNSKLGQLPLQLPRIAEGNVSNFHQYVIRCDMRDKLKAHLAEQGVGTAIYYPVALPLQPCFADLGHTPGDFPVAERCAETSLALPIYPELTSEQLEFVTERISDFFLQ